MSNKHMRRCPTLLIIKEMQITARVLCHCEPKVGKHAPDWKLAMPSPKAIGQ